MTHDGTNLPADHRYLAEHPRTAGAYVDVDKNDTLEDFAAEAPRHPVFRLDAGRPLGGQDQMDAERAAALGDAGQADHEVRQIPT